MESIAANVEAVKTLVHSTGEKSSNCTEILQSFHIEYRELNQYLVVGTIPPIKGWLLNISVIRLHFTPLLKKILPVLADAELAFRIPKSKDTVRTILNGDFGLANIGKIISIYCNNPEAIVHIAKLLVELTTGFRGPRVPASISLGGCVYTQFDGFGGVVEDDKIVTSLKDHSSHWPFDDIMPMPKPISKPLWNNRYKTLSVIKPDPKGRVIQANYFKSLFNIKLCVIKEGVKDMWADEFGRDIVDRIKWQHKLYKQLEGYVPTPRIFDYFEDEGNVYLAMDFIKGDSLQHKVNSTYAGDSWFQLSLLNKLCLIDYSLKTLFLIEKLHKKGFVHRDITPANFIVDKKEQLHLIDMELTYSTNDQQPSPPFKLGTPGYMSPQQITKQTPTEKDDIYALGALMIFIFCGISPSEIDCSTGKWTFQHLSHFTDNHSLVQLIIQCLSKEPDSRPDTRAIIDFLEKYKYDLEASTSEVPHHHAAFPDATEIHSIITTGLRMLASDRYLSKEGIWLSTGNTSVQITEDLAPLDFQTGIAGVLYLLGKAARLDYDISPYKQVYQRNFEYLISQAFTPGQAEDAGFLNGTAGIALAIQEGILGGLIKNNKPGMFDVFFPHTIVDRLDLAAGFAGQGLSLLRCREQLSPALYEARLESIMEFIITKQQRNGTWKTSDKGRNKHNHIGLINGMAGIVNFLMLYCRQHKNDRALISLQRGLQWLAKESKERKGVWPWRLKDSINQTNSLSCAFGTPGIALTFTKAYEFFNDPFFKIMAESTLRSLPKQPLPYDYTQAQGLAGLGEVYLEAYAVLGSTEWGERLNWIILSFVHTFRREKDLGYWAMDLKMGNPINLMAGTAGILHFLIRTQHPGDSKHILLNDE